MTKTVCFKVIYFGPHVSVSVRVFPTWSISCEMSAQTRCRRWPGPLLDVGPWQRAFVETKSRGGGGREERKNRRAGCDLCWCWLLTHSRRLSSLFSPHILPLVFQSSLFSCLSLSEALTLAFLAFTHTHTHTHTQSCHCELSVSAWTDELPISSDGKGNGEKRLQTIYEDTNEISARFSFNL